MASRRKGNRKRCSPFDNTEESSENQCYDEKTDTSPRKKNRHKHEGDTTSFLSNQSLKSQHSQNIKTQKHNTNKNHQSQQAATLFKSNNKIESSLSSDNSDSDSESDDELKTMSFSSVKKQNMRKVMPQTNNKTAAGVNASSDSSSEDSGDSNSEEEQSNEPVKQHTHSKDAGDNESSTEDSEEEQDSELEKQNTLSKDSDDSESCSEDSDDSEEEQRNEPVKKESLSNDSDDNESAEEEDEFTAVKKELANIPLEDLMKVKEKLGLKAFNKIMHGDKFRKKKTSFQRENKNRPMEMSSKKPVPVLRHQDVAKEKVRRDPRFDDLSGEYQDRHFMKNYAFLDEVKSREKELVEKKLKTTKNEDKKKSLTKLLNKMKQQEQIEEKKRHEIELSQQWRDKEKQLVKEGKNPYFLKKADRKKLELAEKFKLLEKQGKVDKFLQKKRKKNAQKEKKKLPNRHERFN